MQHYFGKTGMASSASQIGSLHERQSGSHVDCPDSPLAVTETRSTQSLLFHHPPSRLFLPAILTEPRSPSLDAELSRHLWQTPRPSLYGDGHYEPPLRAKYGIFDGSGISPNPDGSPSTPSSSFYSPSRAEPALYPTPKREESELLVPLSRHSRVLVGILGQPYSCLSGDQSRSSAFQTCSMLSETIAGAPIASSSGLSTTFIARPTNSSTGSFTTSPTLDTSAGAGAFSQYAAGSFPDDGTAPDSGNDQSMDETEASVENGNIGPSRSKKQRTTKVRERIRIALAPDQPPTTQGKQRERVYVACQQW